MDVFYFYSYGSAAWSLLQAMPLALTPTIIIATLSPDVREPTSLESYLCRALALTLCAFGTLVVILTGSVPMTSSLRAKTDEEHPTAPYTLPTLVISLVFHGAIAFLQYGQAMKGNGAPYYFACAVNSVLASIGLWCLLFATDGGHISRRTGVDKRTSGFPFKNKEADKRK